MMHPDEDMLLKLALETLESSEEAKLGGHLVGCERCSAKIREIRRDFKSLEHVGFQLAESEPPPLQRSSRRFATIIRVAAVLVVGFLAGYWVAQLSRPAVATTVQQQLLPTPVIAPVTKVAPCGAIDIPSRRSL